MRPSHGGASVRVPLRYVVLPATLLALLLAGSPGASAGGVGQEPVAATQLADDATTADDVTTVDDVTTADDATTADDDSSTAAGNDAAAATADNAKPTTQSEARPQLSTLVRPLGQVADGTMPSSSQLTEEIADEVASKWLGPSKRRALIVRDALTGTHLADRNADKLVVPASTTKLISAAAIVTGLSPEHTFSTRVVTGASPEEVVLVAGGDMLLARDKGRADGVAGHAGVADLARATAEALKVQGQEQPVTVQLDLDYVTGPDVLATWTSSWVDNGYTGRIVQLGLAEDLSAPYAPSPKNPPQEVAAAFRTALVAEGVRVRDGDDPQAKASLTSAPEGATELASVESAPLRDVLAHALAISDNAMVEQLARQAAVAAGRTVALSEVTAWVKEAVEENYDVDLTEVQLADTSGLSDGTRIPVRAIADVLVEGANGSHPALQSVLAAGGLPIAGYTGTLATRFHLPVHAAAIGNARAKTGSLPGVTSLAGTVVTKDGRLLVYAMTADKIGEDGAVLEARSMLDEIVAQLARCGC